MPPPIGGYEPEPFRPSPGSQAALIPYRPEEYPLGNAQGHSMPGRNNHVEESSRR